MGQEQGAGPSSAARAPAGYPQPQGYPPQGYPPQQQPYGAAPPPGGYYAPPPPAGAWQGAYQPPPPQGYPPQQQPFAYGGAPPPPGAGGPYGMPAAAALPVRPQAPKPPTPGGFDRYDVEAQQAAAAAGAFADKQVRKQFVRKVFILVFLQLAFTVGIASIFMFVEPVRNYVRPGGPGQWVFWVSWVLALGMMIALMCSTTLRRKHPWNIVALFAFTAVQSVLVGVICSYWGTAVVLQAFAVTCAAVAGLTLVAVFGGFDVTKKGHILGMVSGVVFFVILITMIVGFFYVNKWWYLAISVVVALLFAAYLVYDIQMVMGGKANAISPDEYIFASVQIYMDIIIIFLQILNIMGIAQS